MKIDLKRVNKAEKVPANSTVRFHYYLGRGKGAPKVIVLRSKTPR